MTDMTPNTMPTEGNTSFADAFTIWQAANAALHGWQGPGDVPDNLCDAETATWRHMLATPAPDLPALAEKLHRLLRIEPAIDAVEGWSGAEVRQTLADINRLMPSRPTDSHESLLRAWQKEKALWELARCDDAVPLGGDLPDEIDNAHCDATHAALIAFMLHPAKDIGELSQKLRVAYDEAVHGLNEAGRIISALAKDAHRIAYAGVRAQSNA